MSNTAALTNNAHHDAHQSAPPAVCRFGMIMFLASEAMLFAGLIGGYIVLRLARGEPWPPEGAPDIGVQWPLTSLNKVMIINTIILIASSFTFHAAEAAVIKKGKKGLGWMLVTLVLGTIFLSVQAWEWMHLRHDGLWFNTFGIYGSCFFVTTGFHGAHVFIGLLLILWCFLRQLFFGSITKERHASLANVGLYWHFVDVVWVFLYTILYVI